MAIHVVSVQNNAGFLPGIILRKLVSGYEYGRVFPAGVGPALPSRDAADWPPSRFSLSVETRRYGWLRMVFPSMRLFRAPIWCPSKGVAARERRGTPSRCAWQYSIGWIYTRFGEGGGQLDRRQARGGLNPCARESKAARTGRFLREKMMLTTVFFLPARTTRNGEQARFRGLFQGCTGL